MSDEKKPDSVPMFPSLFGRLFGGDSRTSEEYLAALKNAQEYLNASDSELLREAELLRSEPLNHWTN